MWLPHIMIMGETVSRSLHLVPWLADIMSCFGSALFGSCWSLLCTCSVSSAAVVIGIMGVCNSRLGIVPAGSMMCHTVVLLQLAGSKVAIDLPSMICTTEQFHAHCTRPHSTISANKHTTAFLLALTNSAFLHVFQGSMLAGIPTGKPMH